MILFTNLKKVKIGNTEYTPVSILKLTTDLRFSISKLRKSQSEILRLLQKEANENGFGVLINKTNLKTIAL